VVLGAIAAIIVAIIVLIIFFAIAGFIIQLLAPIIAGILILIVIVVGEHGCMQNTVHVSMEFSLLQYIKFSLDLIVTDMHID
jgi:hypothetical protein